MFWYSHLGNPPQISLTVVITVLKPRSIFFRGEFGVAVPNYSKVWRSSEKDPHLDIGA